MSGRELRQHICTVLVLMLVLLVSMVTLGGCCNYKTFTLNEGGFHVSFEYPASYTIKGTQTESDEFEGVYEAVVVFETKGSEGIYPNIDVWKILPKATTSDIEALIEARIEYVLSDIEERATCTLLERKTTMVMGIQADEIIYKVQSKYNKRDVFFQYKGQIWNIIMTSIDATSEADNRAFDHILETFKILE